MTFLGLGSVVIISLLLGAHGFCGCLEGDTTMSGLAWFVAGLAVVSLFCQYTAAPTHVWAIGYGWGILAVTSYQFGASLTGSVLASLVGLSYLFLDLLSRDVGSPLYGLFSGALALGAEMVSFALVVKVVFTSLFASGGNELAILGASILTLLFVICMWVAIQTILRHGGGPSRDSRDHWVHRKEMTKMLVKVSERPASSPSAFTLLVLLELVSVLLAFPYGLWPAFWVCQAGVVALCWREAAWTFSPSRTYQVLVWVFTVSLIVLLVGTLF